MRTVLPHNANLIPPEAKRVFKGIIFEVYQWPQKMYDGSTEIFERLKRPDTVRVVAVKDGRIVVICDEQPARKPILTLPGGRHDNERETELDCAQRELLEETGLSFRDWRLLDVTQPVRKIEHMVYTFLATNFEASQTPKHESGERIKVDCMPLDQLKRAIEKDKNNWPSDILLSVKSMDEVSNFPEFTGGAELV